MQEFSKINLLEQQSSEEFENKIGRIIGLENAAIKALKTISSLNKNDLKTNVNKKSDEKAHSKFSRIKVGNLSKVFDNTANCEIDQSKVNQIAMEAEKKTFETICYYLLDTYIKEQDSDAYKSSKFLCLSQEGNTVEHTCSYFY